MTQKYTDLHENILRYLTKVLWCLAKFLWELAKVYLFFLHVFSPCPFQGLCIFGIFTEPLDHLFSKVHHCVISVVMFLYPIYCSPLTQCRGCSSSVWDKSNIMLLLVIAKDFQYPFLCTVIIKVAILFIYS